MIKKKNKKNPLAGFKKVTSPSNHKAMVAAMNDASTDFDRSSKKNMTSITKRRNERRSNNNSSHHQLARYHSGKYLVNNTQHVSAANQSHNKDGGKTDRTVKKISVGKMITLGSTGLKMGILTERFDKSDRHKDKIIDKELSLSSRFGSMRNIDKKSVSSKTIGVNGSISLGKSTNMNSVTLKSNHTKTKKRRGEKSA